MDLSHIADLLTLRTAVEKEVLYEIFTELGEAERSQMLKRLEANLKEQEKYRDEADYFGRFPDLEKAIRLSQGHSRNFRDRGASGFSCHLP